MTLFGQNKINKLIFIDVGTFIVKNPNESDKENLEHGGIFSDAWRLYNQMKIFLDDGNEEYNVQVPQPKDDISSESSYYKEIKKLGTVDLDHSFQASLFFNIITNDWRDVVKRIEVPTMYIWGETSRATSAILAEWYKKNISTLQVTSFSREEFGRHSMFASNPEKFNKTVIDFLKD